MKDNSEECSNRNKCGTCVVEEARAHVELVNQCNKHHKEEILCNTTVAEIVGK